MPDRATELTEALGRTEEAVKGLARRVGVHQSTLRRVKAAFAAGLAALALALVLILLVANNQGRIGELQEQARMETERNKVATCAMVALFLQFEPRTLANPAYTEEQKVEQRQAYDGLRQTGEDLGCPRP